MRKLPQRTCIICRGKFPKKTLTRYVMRASGLVTDVRHVMHGRGCYCCSRQMCLSQMKVPETNVRKIFRLTHEVFGVE